VSRRRVLEAVFVLLEFSSPSRRIFIGSHSLPPSLVRRIGPSLSGLDFVRGMPKMKFQKDLVCAMCRHDKMVATSHPPLTVVITERP
jgi:hypothetical protein